MSNATTTTHQRHLVLTDADLIVPFGRVALSLEEIDISHFSRAIGDQVFYADTVIFQRTSGPNDRTPCIKVLKDRSDTIGRFLKYPDVLLYSESQYNNLKWTIENAHAALDESDLLMPRENSHQGLINRIKSLVVRAAEIKQKLDSSPALGSETAAELLSPRTELSGVDLVNAAKAIAERAHINQTRRDGKTPYINHVRAVVERLGTAASDDEIAVAWLHDAVEDGGISLAGLWDAGIPKSVVLEVDILTKLKNQNYQNYLERVKSNPVARKVKIADMLSNMADDPTEKQILKYSEGLTYLLK